jgi:hypothetical protein
LGKKIVSGGKRAGASNSDKGRKVTQAKKLAAMGVTTTPPLNKSHKALFSPDGTFFWPGQKVQHWEVAQAASPEFRRYAEGDDEGLNPADFAKGDYHTTETRGKPAIELMADASEPSPRLQEQLLNTYGKADPLPVLRYNGAEIEDWDLEFEDMLEAA